MIQLVIRPFWDTFCAHERIIINHPGNQRKNSDPSKLPENLFVVKTTRYNKIKSQLIITRDVFTTLCKEYARSGRIVYYFCKKHCLASICFGRKDLTHLNLPLYN